jgi:hypothetical protein
VQILVAEPFGFSEDGRMNITVSDFMLWSPGNVKKKGPYNRCGGTSGTNQVGHAGRLMFKESFPG